MYDLKLAAEAIGFEVEACVISFRALEARLSQPGEFAILLLGKRHFVAAIGTRGRKTVLLVDGSLGFKDLDENELQEQLRWSGHALLLSDRG